MKTVILTDLDGTLLDHDGYSYHGALPALERIRRDAVPLEMAAYGRIDDMERQAKALGYPEIA